MTKQISSPVDNHFELFFPPPNGAIGPFDTETGEPLIPPITGPKEIYTGYAVGGTSKERLHVLTHLVCHDTFFQVKEMDGCRVCMEPEEEMQD